MLFGLFKVRDRSMLPKIKDGDYLIVSMIPYLFRRPSVNDVIVLRHPKKTIFLVKRIARASKKHYYVEGDNREHSEDSRSFGWVSGGLILGKVLYVVRA